MAPYCPLFMNGITRETSASERMSVILCSWRMGSAVMNVIMKRGIASPPSIPSSVAASGWLRDALALKNVALNDDLDHEEMVLRLMRDMCNRQLSVIRPMIKRRRTVLAEEKIPYIARRKLFEAPVRSLQKQNSIDNQLKIFDFMLENKDKHYSALLSSGQMPNLTKASSPPAIKRAIRFSMRRRRNISRGRQLKLSLQSSRIKCSRDPRRGMSYIERIKFESIEGNLAALDIVAPSRRPTAPPDSVIKVVNVKKIGEKGPVSVTRKVRIVCCVVVFVLLVTLLGGTFLKKTAADVLIL
jgi:hypothetical protein